ncbi:hypothetical protein YC2023_115994 [Brassica napus]
MSVPASDDAYERSSSIYSRIWISDLAPGSSPLERSNGSGGDSVSTGFVVTHVGGVSAPGGVVASQTPLRRASGELRWILLPRWRVLSQVCRRSRLSLWSITLWFMFYLSLFGTGDGLLQLRVLLFGSRRLQVWGDSRLQSLIAQWLAWFCSHPSSAEGQLFLCSGAAFPLFADYKASGRGFGGTYNRSYAWIALLPKSIL